MPLKIENFNGKVVTFDKRTLKIFQTYKPFNQKIGIAFVTKDDRYNCVELNLKPPYVHVVHICTGDDQIAFYRFPIDTLKLSTKTVPLTLKKKAQRQIKNYLKNNYLDNLSYIEAVANLQRIKTK